MCKLFNNGPCDCVEGPGFTCKDLERSRAERAPAPNWPFPVVSDKVRCLDCGQTWPVTSSATHTCPEKR